MTVHPIAREIARQIGNEAFMLMGSTGGTMLADVDSLTFGVKGSGRVNRIRVKLDPSDTYTLTFYKIGRAPKCSVAKVDEIKGVYVDMLHDLIEAGTGLFVSFRPRS